MPLDILIDTGSKENAKPLMLFIEEYDSIMEVLEKEESFPIMKTILLNYYGESEVYINKLTALRQEVMQFKTFKVSEKVGAFLNEFVKLIESAEREKCTIKLIGD
ncbi:MAG: hypothetical protein WDO16_25985 [Bacteroidota bacterium]